MAITIDKFLYFNYINKQKTFKIQMEEGLKMQTPIANGFTINSRYEIMRHIKEGGMAQIYFCKDKNLNRDCILKELWGGNFPNQDIQEITNAFKREAEILANLDHPNLPRVTDYFIIGDTYYLAMDYIEGNDLESLAAGKNIDEQEVIQWVVKILEVFEYLHSQNKPIIYRDMKPSNVMLSKTGKIKIIDFGVARWLPQNVSGQTAIGTPGYAAPEQYNGESDHRSDLYSLGVTMYFLLTKEPPKMLKLTPIEKLRPQTSRQLVEIINKATDMRPDFRYQSAGEMKQALVNLNLPTNQITTPILDPELISALDRFSNWMIKNVRKLNEDFFNDMVMVEGYYKNGVSSLALQEIEQTDWTDDDNFPATIISDYYLIKAKLFKENSADLNKTMQLLQTSAEYNPNQTEAYREITVLQKKIETQKQQEAQQKLQQQQAEKQRRTQIIQKYTQRITDISMRIWKWMTR